MVGAKQKTIGAGLALGPTRLALVVVLTLGTEAAMEAMAVASATEMKVVREVAVGREAVKVAGVAPAVGAWMEEAAMAEAATGVAGLARARWGAERAREALVEAG
jgi:hypothetical protein